MTTLDRRAVPSLASASIGTRRELVGRLPVVVAILLGATYLGIRLANLGSLPMVSDEGPISTGGPCMARPRPFGLVGFLEDGKQPLLAWLMIPFLSVIPDRLIAGA